MAAFVRCARRRPLTRERPSSLRLGGPSGHGWLCKQPPSTASIACRACSSRMPRLVLPLKLIAPGGSHPNLTTYTTVLHPRVAFRSEHGHRSDGFADAVDGGDCESDVRRFDRSVLATMSVWFSSVKIRRQRWDATSNCTSPTASDPSTGRPWRRRRRRRLFTMLSSY